MHRAALALALLGSFPFTPGCFLFSRGSRTAASETASPPSAELTLSPGFGQVDPIAGVAEGRQQASALAPRCVGFIADAPSVVLHVPAGGFSGLQVLAQSDVDTTLVVRHPDGSYSCDDDSGGARNPRVSTAFAEGDHLIWVGTYGGGNRAQYSLRFGEGDAPIAATASAVAAPGTPYVGTVTIENRTSTPICRVESDDGTRMLDTQLRIEPGASGALTVQEQLLNIWIQGCDGRVLFGAPNPSLTTPGTYHIGALDVPVLTLVESEAAVARDAGRRFLVAAPMSTSEYLAGVLVGLRGRNVSDAMNTPALRSTALAALREGGRAEGWSETFLAFRMTSSEWTIVRHRLTGVILHQVIGGVSVDRAHDGMCQASWRSFTQEHDGRDFRGPLRWSQNNGVHRIPCAVAETATAASDWAH